MTLICEIGIKTDTRIGLIQGFEQLLTEQNKLNQKLDQVRGVGGEFSALAVLWSNLHELMCQQELVASELNKSTSGGYPGSGSHVIGR